MSGDTPHPLSGPPPSLQQGYGEPVYLPGTGQLGAPLMGGGQMASGMGSGMGGGGYPLAAAAPPEDESSIFARLRRRKFTFVFTFLPVLGLVALAYAVVPHTYRSTASVLVSSADVVLSDPKAQGGDQNVGDPADLESQSVVLGSPQLVRDVLAQPAIRQMLIDECEQGRQGSLLGLPLAPLKDRLFGPPLPCATQIDDPAEVMTLAGRYTVLASGRSRVIDVSFTSPSAQVTQVMTNALVQAYLDLRTGEKLRPRDAAITWLRAEIERLGGKLRRSEQTIEAFLNAHDLVKGQTAPIASERLTNLSQQLALAEADQAAAAGRMAQSRSGGGDVGDVLNSRSVGDLKQQLALVNAQIAQMQARYGSAYPGLAAMLDQRSVLAGALGAETGRVVSSVSHDYQAAASRVAALRAQVDALKKDVGAGDDATTQIAALQRDTDVDRELYLDLTKRVNELEAERRLVVGDARLVNFAELPDKVFFPKKITFGLTGLLLATAFATVAALLRDRADGSVRAAGRLQLASGLRVLAHIPPVRRVGTGGSKLAHQLERPSAFQEAIRGLYAECMLLNSEQARHSILVTSSQPVEGKTFVTLALAHFAAAAGKRVLVMECDLRRPSFARALSLRAGRGIVDYLRGRATPEEILLASSTEGLDVMLAGKPAMNSTELLSDRRLRALLDWAGTRYDLVLLDSPPTQVLRDARVLARQVDAVLYTAQWGQSQMSAVLDGVAAIQAAGGHVLGLVLDRVQTEQYALYNAHAQAQDSYLTLQAD